MRETSLYKMHTKGWCVMDILKPTAVIGTNSWGGKLYCKTLRGSYVEDEVIKDAMKTAKEKDIALFDLARDYGLGKAEKMIGEFGTEDIVISAKYTPFTHYKPGCVRKSLMKDLRVLREITWKYSGFICIQILRIILKRLLSFITKV